MAAFFALLAAIIGSVFGLAQGVTQHTGTGCIQTPAIHAGPLDVGKAAINLALLGSPAVCSTTP